VAILHEQKWVDSKDATITGNVTNKPWFNHQWSLKEPFGKRIVPGNSEYFNMSPLEALLHMMLSAQLGLMFKMTNLRLVTKGKPEMNHQELLWWIGVCNLITSIKF
jgi:hypothetical protein